MAYDIIGNVYKIGTLETFKTKNGNTMHRRSLTLEQKRYDPNTGEEYTPNYPTIEFSGEACNKLDSFHQGDRVRIRFDISGVRYNDKQTGEERYLTLLRGFRIESYALPQTGVIPQQPQYAPQQQYAQPQYAQQQQQAAQDYNAPFPPQPIGKVSF